MPEVPRAQRQISRVALPGARRTAAETPTSQGAGLEAARGRAAETLADVGASVGRFGAQMFARLEAEARERADNVARLKWQNRFAEFETARILDPEQGVLARQGEAAFTAPEETDAAFAELAGEIERGLITDRQKEAFARDKLTFQTSMQATVRRHVTGEMQRFEAAQLTARVSNATNAAIANAQDPRRVALELSTAEQQLRLHGPNLGMGSEQVEQEIGKVRTAVHSGVIGRLLAVDQERAAKVYFEETRDQIDGTAIAKLEEALEAGSRRKEAQRRADEILAAGGTLQEQRAKARTIDDAQLRDDVMTRLEHEAAVQERADREAHGAVLRSVYDRIERGTTLNALERLPEWQNLEGNERRAAREYLEARLRGIPVETDLGTYYGLMRRAMNDPDGFMVDNLLNYRNRLGETEFKQLAGLQLSLTSGRRGDADVEIEGFRTRQQVLNATLGEYGINTDAKPGSDEANAIAQLQRMLDVRVEGFTRETGKKPTSTDLQGMLDDIFSRHVRIDRGGILGLFGGAREKRLIDMTIDDVPAGDKAQIMEALRRRGRPVNDQTILNTYVERLYDASRAEH